MLPKLPPKRADSAASYAAAYAAYASPARTSPSYSAGPSSTAAQSSYSFNPYDSSTANPYSSHSFNLYGSSSSNPYNTPFVGYGQGGKKKSDMLKKLHSEPLFINPEGINILLRAYNINEYGTVCERPPLDPRHNYKNLRERQNQAWARDSVNRGLALAKEGKYASAHKCYKHALEIDATFVDAFIAMGAAYVFQGRLLEAVAEFETALRVDPHNLGAQRYLEAAQQRLGIVPVRSMTQQPGYSDAMTTSASSVYGASSPGGGLGLGAGAGLGVNTGASSGAGTIGSSSSSSNSRGPSNSNMSYRENYSGGDDTNSNPSSIISLLVGNLTTSNSTSGESRVSNLSMDDQLIAERERHVRKYLRKEEKKSKKRKRSKEKKKSKKKDKKKKRKKDGDGSDDSSNSDSEDSSDS
jgi:tetratricopeptide (TPR) repeat protein